MALPAQKQNQGNRTAQADRTGRKANVCQALTQEEDLSDNHQQALEQEGGFKPDFHPVLGTPPHQGRRNHTKNTTTSPVKHPRDVGNQQDETNVVRETGGG